MQFQALGRLPKGRMNKTEAAYVAFLESQKLVGEVLEYRFHPLNVRLADNTFYEIDFLVMAADMSLQIHEVKGGFTTDKGQMKVKLCAEVLPFIRVLKVTNSLLQLRAVGFFRSCADGEDEATDQGILTPRS